MPANLEDRVRAVPGVAERARVSSPTPSSASTAAGRCAWWCRDSPGPRTRATGCRWWRAVRSRQAHYEMIADRSLGLALGEQLKLGKDVYAVVGLTRGMVASGGDGLALLHRERCAWPSSSMCRARPSRLERAARVRRGEAQDLGRVQPLLLERAGGPASGIPALAPPQVSAITGPTRRGRRPAAVAATISTWPDVTVYIQASNRRTCCSPAWWTRRGGSSACSASCSSSSPPSSWR